MFVARGFNRGEKYPKSSGLQPLTCGFLGYFRSLFDRTGTLARGLGSKGYVRGTALAVPKKGLKFRRGLELQLRHNSGKQNGALAPEE